MFDYFNFSERTSWTTSSNELIEKINHLKEGGVKLYNLTESNPTCCDFSYLNKKLTGVLSNNENLRYKPASTGYPEAKKSICKYYKDKDYEVDPRQIILTSSTSEAYSILFRLLANYTDNIHFPQPSYPLFQFLVDLNDVNMKYYPILYKEGWCIDFKALNKTIDLKSKAIVLVNPNNPTSSYVKKYELDNLNSICEENQLPIISDEVFWDFNISNSKDVVSLVDNKKVPSFVLGGISKTLGLPQMKLSWIVVNGPTNIIEEALKRIEIITDTYLSVNTPTQNALDFWLSLRGKIQKEILDRINKNLKTLEKQIKKSKNCVCLKVEGGWYAIIKVPNILDDHEWAMKLLEEDNVFVHPGYFFDFQKDSHIVISLLPKIKDFGESINRILKRIEQEIK